MGIASHALLCLFLTRNGTSKVGAFTKGRRRIHSWMASRCSCGTKRMIQPPNAGCLRVSASPEDGVTRRIDSARKKCWHRCQRQPSTNMKNDTNAGSGCPDTTCSASSSPKTLLLARTSRNISEWIMLSSELERELNESYEKIRECVDRLGACADGYSETREAIADLAAILPQNARAMASGESESPLK